MANESTSEISTTPAIEAPKITEAAEAAALAALQNGEHVQQGDISLSRASAAAAWNIRQSAAAQEAARAGVRPVFLGINLSRMG
jgi:hypothetical protein